MVEIAPDTDTAVCGVADGSTVLIPQNSYVNLGIGRPTAVADHLDPAQGIVLHTENGMLGMGPRAYGDDIDPDLLNAGKIPVTELPGASYFDHAQSFAMMRGGHLDVPLTAVPRHRRPLVAQAMHVSAAGNASSRASPMSSPQRTQRP
jgi:3-oxoacid CoA-transferase B subunit